MLYLHSSTGEWKNSDLDVEVGYWRPETDAMGVDWWSPCVVKGVCEIWVPCRRRAMFPRSRSTAPPVSALMPKRRVPSDEEDEASDNTHKSASEEEVVKKSKKSSAKSEKSKASVAVLTRVTPIVADLRPQAQPIKKQKKGEETIVASEGVKTNEEGEQYIDLGRNRRATVRVFKGTSLFPDAVRQSGSDGDHHPGIPLIDIREFFNSGKDQKPGKKGISLKAEEVNKYSTVSIVSVDDEFTVASAQAKCRRYRRNLVRH